MFTSILQYNYNPRLVHDPKETGVDEVMLYIPLPLYVVDGVVRVMPPDEMRI
jgi:hypothetical protein